MIKLFKYLRTKEWLFITASVAFIVLQVWLDLKLPDYMKQITNIISATGATNEIWAIGGKMLAIAFGSAVASIAVGFFASRVAAAFSMRLRGMLFNKVQDFSMEEINTFSTSSLITRSTNDVTQVQQFIAMGMQIIIKAPIMAVWALSKISSKSWQWTLATAVAVVLLLCVVIIIISLMLPKFKIIQKLTDNLNMVTRENLTGLRVVRAYNAEDYQKQKFETANNEFTKTNLFANRTMAIMFPSMSIIMNGLTLVIYWIGAYLINQAVLASKPDIFSDMIIFSSYAMQVIMSFLMLTTIFIMLPRVSVSAKRINEVLDKEIIIKNGTLSAQDCKSKGEIQLKNVCFKYPDASEYVLENINLSIKSGETVAFIGSTGSGKSTLINLIPRFYDVTEGQVLIDGIDIKNYNLHDLHNKMGYVPQRAVMFSGTVKSNVSYGESGKSQPTEEELLKAIEVAQALEFVSKMEGGIEAHISQGGTNVSGGQKQRLSIARAIARTPEIFIFDDSFSALDYKTDKQLRKALKKHAKDATVLIVAQRVGTIMDADNIVVLDCGQIVGMGKHKQLMKDCSVYQQIAYSQLSKEELANE